jgi:hypothetical protein
MDTTTKQPVTQPVVDYTFEVLGRSMALIISIWPDQGDTATQTPVGWGFTFPRLKKTITVLARNVIYADVTHTARPFVTTADVVELLRARREAKEHAKAENAEKDQSGT